MRSFEAIPALLLLLLLWCLLGRVYVCKCVCACVVLCVCVCVYRLVDGQQMTFVLFPRAALTKYHKLIVFKLQKFVVSQFWVLEVQSHDVYRDMIHLKPIKEIFPGLWWFVSNLWCYLVGTANTLILGPHIAIFLYFCLHKYISLIELGAHNTTV